MAGKIPPSAKSGPTQNRDDRLKAALKANLGRRKVQARARLQAVSGEQDKKTDTNKG
jgi:hypothetical protein